MTPQGAWTAVELEAAYLAAYAEGRKDAEEQSAALLAQLVGALEGFLATDKSFTAASDKTLAALSDRRNDLAPIVIRARAAIAAARGGANTAAQMYAYARAYHDAVVAAATGKPT